MGSGTRVGAVLAVVAVAGGLPARGAAGPPHGWDLVRGEAVARLAAARGLLASGRLEDAVRAAAGLAGVPMGEGASTSADPPAGLPPGLAGPLARLLGAVEVAEGLAARALRAGPGAVDRRSLHAGALALARALDETLPALPAAVGGLAAGRPSVGCDLADQPPALCVGGTGPNTYDRDYALLVDLGGDDVHANSAGGADPLGSGLAVSVAVDLGGNDRYETALPTSSASRAVQGSGYLGGIGVLVDVGGDDRYAATSSTRGIGAWAQGLGLAGAGIHADLGGNDTYRVSNVSPAGSVVVNPFGGGSEHAAGRGFAAFGGLGIALDGGGNDAGAVETRLAQFVDDKGRLHAGFAALAQGYGFGAFGGVGVFSDAGGTDSMALEAVTAPVAPDDTRPLATPSASAYGVGVGGAGAGVALTGPGSTAWSVRTEVSAPKTGAANAGGFARATVGGYGALHDAGGSDVYRQEAVSRAVRRAAVDDSCGCPGVQAVADAGQALLEGAAFAGLGGVALLQDAGGDDAYVSVATSEAEAEARDDRSEPGPPPAEGEVAGADASAVAATARSRTQGFAINGGAGLVEDAAGNDRYDSRATSTAGAVASARHPDAPVVAGAASATATSEGQAAGVSAAYGEVRDAGGADTYLSSSTSRSTEDPGGESPGPAVSSVQASADGAGTAHLADVDGGANDTFTASPADPACLGMRGQGVWRDCGQGAAVGVNA